MSPFWTVHPWNCDGVNARLLTIVNPDDSPNTDGFDPDSSRNIILEDTFISVGDDAIAIKSGWDCYGIIFNVPSENIYIRNLTVYRADAGICLGSEMSGGIRNVTVLDSYFYKTTWSGLRLKSN